MARFSETLKNSKIYMICSNLFFDVVIRSLGFVLCCNCDQKLGIFPAFETLWLNQEFSKFNKTIIVVIYKTEKRWEPILIGFWDTL